MNALHRLLTLVEGLNPTGEIGDGMVAELHDLAGRVRAEPIPMILHCPVCGSQHIDESTAERDNPPHRSHLCGTCGNIWRPADVPTVGVASIETEGAADWPPLNRL